MLVEWRYVRYKSIKYHTSYIAYIPSSTVRTKRTVRGPEQSEKIPFGYKSRQMSHSSPHFLITMKNGIQETRKTEMTVGSMELVICAAAALVLQLQKKRQRE